MAQKSSKDITIEFLYDLKDLIDDAIEKLNSPKEDQSKPLIDIAEECLVNLNDKTRNIYSSMLSDYLSSLESPDMIESKKENTSKGG